MQDRQLMEQNLARLLREAHYKSCGSDAGDQVTGDPVNPFMKRVFAHKLRRSSVASENTNPNIQVIDTFDGGDCTRTISEIVDRGLQCLERVRASTILEVQRVEKGSETEQIASRRTNQILHNLQKSIGSIVSYLDKTYNQPMLPLPVSHKTRVSSVGRHEDPLSESRNSKPHARPKKQKEAKAMSGSLVSQASNYRSGQPRSVYESVLEERRNRKHRNSRII